MPTRLRLLIYKGSEKQIEMQRMNDGVRPGTGLYLKPHGTDPGLLMTSIELDPTRMTIRELLRVLFGREGR